MRRFLAALLIAAFAVSAPAASEPPVRAERAWARATPPRPPAAAVYLTLVNGSDRADRLVGVMTSMAAEATLHAHAISAEGVATMRPVEAVDLPARSTTVLAPGGYHVMLSGVAAGLREGDRFTVDLVFAHAPPLSIEVEVMGIAAAGPTDTTHRHH